MTERPLRRDAARNRELLLTAAAEVFAEHGLGASVEEVARVAGVGMGTLYRRFPTKEDLIEALVTDVLVRAIELARDVAGTPDALISFLRGLAELEVRHLGCLARVWNTEHELVPEARALIAGLLTEAQARGEVRTELTPTDVTVTIWAVRGVIESTRGAGWQRHLEIVAAGLRPAAAPLAHPPLTRAAVDGLLRR